MGRVFAVRMLVPIASIIAIGVGIIIATQSAMTVGTALILGTVVSLSLMTPLVGLSVLLVLAPLRTLVATEANYPLPVDVGLILYAVFVILQLIHTALQRNLAHMLQTSRVYVPIGLILVVFGVNLASSTSPAAWLNEWLKWLIVLSLVVLMLMHKSSWRQVIAILVAAGVANALIGLYIFFGGSGADHLLILDRFFRAFGTFGQPNPFGGFLGMLLPLAVAMALGDVIAIWQRWRSRLPLWSYHWVSLVYFGCSSALLMMAIVASWSRGAWLGVVAAFGVMSVVLPHRNWQRLSLVVTGTLMLAILWFGGLLPQSVVNRIASSAEDLLAFEDARGVDITTENYAVVERLAHWQAALNMAEAAPYLGVGLGNYEVVYEEFRLLNWDEPLGHAHNYYLNVFGEVGIVGLVAYIAFWILIVLITLQVRTHPDFMVQLLATGLMGTWSYFSVHSLFDNLYVNNLFIHLGILFGILAVLFKDTKQSFVI